MIKTFVRFAPICLGVVGATALLINLTVADDELERALMTPPAATPTTGGALGSLDDVLPQGSGSLTNLPTAQDDSLDAVESAESDGIITVNNAKVEIPKGEGFEATISANGQGLLVELGLCEVDENGAVVTEPDGSSRRKTLARGLVVKKGDILGKQQDDELVQERIVAQQELLVAQKEAEKTLEVEVADAAARVAHASYKRAEQLNNKLQGAVSEEEVQEKFFEWLRADKSIAKAKYDLEINREKVKVAAARVQATDVQIRNRKFRSPIDGVIDDLLVNEGEWLREGTEVLHIIRLDKVQVTGALNATKYAPEDIDQKDVVVMVTRPGYDPIELPGKIVYVRQVVESGHYYFYAEVTNQKTDSGYWLLNPGSLVSLRIKR